MMSYNSFEKEDSPITREIGGNGEEPLVRYALSAFQQRYCDVFHFIYFLRFLTKRW